MRVATTLGLLAMAVIFLIDAIGMTGSSRLLPLAAAGLLVPALTIELVRDLTRADRPSQDDLGRPRDALLWAAALPVAIALVGIVAGSAVFVVAYLRIRSAERWWTCIAGGAATALSVLGVLSWLLGIDLPQGALFRW